MHEVNAPAPRAPSLRAPSRTDVFLIHGMWSHSGAWGIIQRQLAARGRTSVAAMLPGHDTMPGDLAVLGLSDYVDALAEQYAAAGRPPCIMGHSMGGLLAQLLAVRVQPQALVLLATAASATTSRPAFSALKSVWPVISRWRFWTKATRLPEHAARYGVYNGVPEAEVVQSIRELQPDSGRVMLQMAMPWLDKTRAAHVDYARLSMPTLVMCGDADRITLAAVSRATAAAVTGPVTVAMLSGHGHQIIGEQAGPDVADRVADFLDTQLGPVPPSVSAPADPGA